MICPDCGMEVEKLNRKGICIQCGVRLNNVSYLNRKNGTNIKYVPLVKLKEIDPTMYEGIMKRRSTKGNRGKNKSVATKTKKQEIVKENNSQHTTDLQQKYYAKVSKDLDVAFSEAGVSKDYLSQNKNISSIVDTLLNLLSNDNSNIMMQCKQGEKIFNKLSDLYRHEQENLDWSDVEKINEMSYAQKALQELRRPTKDLIYFYEALDELIEYLKQDTNFMYILNNAKKSMDYRVERVKNPKYYSSVESDMCASDSVVKAEDTKIKIYYCTVWCYNLNGDPSRRLFKTNRGIYARNEIDAKLKLKMFLADKFATVTYKDSDITIKEVQSQDEIKELLEVENY